MAMRSLRLPPDPIAVHDRAMPEQDLDQLLHALRDELARTNLADARSRELAAQLLAATDELSARRAAGTPPPAPTASTYTGRLRAAVEHFEATHPALTETMNRIARALGDAGL